MKSSQIVLQILAYAAFAVVLGYFAAAPAYVHLDPEKALIKLSFSHAGERKTECRRLSPEEIAKLAPNMRRALDCPRERVPLLVELFLDDELLYRDLLRPSGLARDGTSTAYQRFPAEPGFHHLVVRLRDTRRSEGFDWELASDIHLVPQQNLVVDFRAEAGGFKIL